jgi:hypothetical protein
MCLTAGSLATDRTLRQVQRAESVVRRTTPTSFVSSLTRFVSSATKRDTDAVAAIVCTNLLDGKGWVSCKNTRNILLSDLFFDTLEVQDGMRLVKLDCLLVYANQSKTNQTGRTDEVGAIRHRDPLICPINAIMLQLFAHFHLRGALGNVDFAPDWSTASVAG